MSSSPKAIDNRAPARFLNFGCGRTFHRDWTNLDAFPVSPEVIAHDLRTRFPFADASFDAVYGSHVLEHLEPATAKALLRDCFRIIKPEGIVRIAVPDLESIARLYVASLEGALKGDRAAEMRYDWIMLELLDQTVRKVSGGNMAALMAGSKDADQARFICERIGPEREATTTLPAGRFSLAVRVRRKLRGTAKALRRKATIAAAWVLLGRQGAVAVREGLFRSDGEVHQWMYDRFSLTRALRGAGFVAIKKRSAGESEIPGFSKYELEVFNGRELKPDSLYLEGRKPARADLAGGKSGSG